ncbi:MAG: bifunctional phosphopantothenoylcysteine decarboxylase/phosphopantothenate--cysteine ligase CoaBC [Candidatus Aminicenantes bacterium]|nr:bifunctional phosphopantothenoylcysteine decarboxylase/phosphopantothenate--cysteine ligase CoaBC [Candidatus Aminicenantes bacterium]
MAKIALGVTSSVSIYKACEVLRGFQKAGHDVQVIMSRNAAKLISPLLFNSLSGHKTIVELFEEDHPWSVAHIALAKEVGLLAVVPATANIIGKFASGVADDFLSTFYLAVEAPILVAPAMNEAMLLHRQTQDNMMKLRAQGVDFVEPAKGYLACGDEGWGRLADPDDIVRRGLELLKKRVSLQGKTILVTAGPTREYLDPVRFLSNRSSGKMGFEMAREALLRGARVILVAGPSQVAPPAKADLVRIESAADMEKEVLKRFPKADIVVMAAAVADFTFAERTGRKIKRQDLPEALRLVRTMDILKALGERKKGQFLVGFAAETEDLRANAGKKIKAKKLDFIVANDVSREGTGFDADDNQALLIDAKGHATETQKMSKRELSRVIWDAIEASLGKRR